MNKLGIVRSLLGLSLALLTVSSLASGFDNEFEEKPWVEIEVQLPAFPQIENLVAFKVGAASDTQFKIDSQSLSVGADAVIRYTLVVVSSAGAENISYEGMRCTTGERRFYAFGRSDGTWSKARNTQWMKIQGSSNNHHVELFVNYFCSFGAPTLTSADDAVRALRNGGYRWK